MFARTKSTRASKSGSTISIPLKREFTLRGNQDISSMSTELTGALVRLNDVCGSTGTRTKKRPDKLSPLWE